MNEFKYTYVITDLQIYKNMNLLLRNFRDNYMLWGETNN